MVANMVEREVLEKNLDYCLENNFALRILVVCLSDLKSEVSASLLFFKIQVQLTY